MLEPFGDLCVSCVKVNNFFFENREKYFFFKNRGRTLNGVKLFLQILWTKATKIWYLNDNHFTPVLEASSQGNAEEEKYFGNVKMLLSPRHFSHWDPLCTHVNVFSVDVFNVIKEYSGGNLHIHEPRRWAQRERERSCGLKWCQY